jgi:hypothetical protein
MTNEELDKIRIPRAAMTAWQKLLEQQIACVAVAIDSLVAIHRVANELTCQEDCAHLEALESVIRLLDSKMDPESEVQLREMVLTVLDQIDAEKEAEARLQ